MDHRMGSRRLNQRLKLEEKIKSPFWRDRYSTLWCFICPLCEATRKVPFRPKPEGFRQVFQVVLTSIIFMLVSWKWMNWKGIVSFFPFWMVFETVYRWKIRAALSCPQCGFDPYLFLVNEKWARREVDAYWRKKFADKGIAYPESGGPSVAKAPLVSPPKTTPVSPQSPAPPV